MYWKVPTGNEAPRSKLRGITELKSEEFSEEAFPVASYGERSSSKDTIVAVLDKLLRTSQLKIDDVQAAWTAFRMYQKGKADLADCLLGATNRIGGCEWTVTFDRPASKLGGFQLL